MSKDRNELVVAALNEWRLSDVERDWHAVVAGVGGVTAPQKRRILGVAGRRRYSWRWRVAVAALVLVVATPAIGAISGAFSWPWTHRPGAQLVASVPGGSLQLNSHGGLVVRTSRGIRFLSPVPTRQKRRFVWQLATDARVASAEILLGRGPAVELCAPCSDGESGRFTLGGSRALDVLNGRATLRVRSEGRTATSSIQLKRLR